MAFVIRRNAFIAENHFRPLIEKDECEYDHVLLGPRSSSVLPLQGCCHSRPRSNGNENKHFLNETQFRHCFDQLRMRMRTDFRFEKKAKFPADFKLN